MEKPKLQQPCLWYMNIAILLGATAYPSVTWLPVFVEKYRSSLSGLLISQFLFARNLGAIFALATCAALSSFILSAFYSELKSPTTIKWVGLGVIGLYTLYVLILFACLALA